jgi:hypothetical protein
MGEELAGEAAVGNFASRTWPHQQFLAKRTQLRGQHFATQPLGVSCRTCLT